MGDMGEFFNDLKEHRKRMRREKGINCPGCIKDHPKRDPTILLPGQRCKVCGHRRPHEAQEAADG